MTKLQGKVAIITGAARGQGAATAQLFAREGCAVIVTDISGGDDVMRDVGDLGRFHRHDVADAADWRKVVDAATAEFGRIDILVNNAGVVHIGDFLGTSPADFQKVLNINLMGAFHGMQAVLPGMLERKAGSIVNISSVSGMTGMAGMSIYSASKWGIRGLTRSVALEVAPHGIRINSIHPGAINTPMLNPNNDIDQNAAARHQRIAMGRLGQPDEIANASLFLASDDASYMTGTEMVIDGAWIAGLTSDGAVDPNA